ncbi:MAG TPA: VOC family protein [Acidobacteriota bacterium]|nr:VOC family protein [Acidobacteriota bacterium]
MAKIKHIEVAGPDGGRLKSFYGDLFHWDMKRRDIAGFDYYDLQGGSEPSLGIRHEPQGSAEIVIYIEVDDLEGTVEKAQKLGASVRIPPMEHEGLRFALVEDPEGNPVGLTQAT